MKTGDLIALKAAIKAAVFDIAIHLDRHNSDILQLSRSPAYLRLVVVGGEGAHLLCVLEDGDMDETVGLQHVGQAVYEVLRHRHDVWRQHDRRLKDMGLRGDYIPPYPRLRHYRNQIASYADAAYVQALRALDVPDQQLMGMLPREVDGFWNADFRSSTEALGLTPSTLKAEKITSLIGQDWTCPGCGRSKAAAIRFSARGQAFLSLPRHHDHAGDGKPGPKRRARFPITVVCNDCNVAEAAAKGQLVRSGLVEKWFSFAPWEIHHFITSSPNQAHKVHHARAARLIREDPGIQDYLKRVASDQWPVIFDEQLGAYALNDEIYTCGNGSDAVGLFGGCLSLAGRLGVEDPVSLSHALQERSFFPAL